MLRPHLIEVILLFKSTCVRRNTKFHLYLYIHTPLNYDLGWFCEAIYIVLLSRCIAV